MRLSQELPWGKEKGSRAEACGPDRSAKPNREMDFSPRVEWGRSVIASLSLVAFDLLRQSLTVAVLGAPRQDKRFERICPAHGTVGVLYPSSIFQSTPGSRLTGMDHLDMFSPTSSRRESGPKIQKGPGPTFR